MEPRIISCAEAEARGLLRYYTGKPCSYGHTVERLVSNGRCVECARLQASRWRRNHPDKNRAIHYRWRGKNREAWLAHKRSDWAKHSAQNVAKQQSNRRANPARVMLNDARKRARQTGLPFSITKADVLMPAMCPVFGVPMVLGSGRRTDWSPSLDRIENSLGYVPGNVVVVSWKANRIKSDASASDLRMVAEFYGTPQEQPIGLELAIY